MAPLGVGGIQLVNNSMLSAQDAMNVILHEIQKLQATKDDLRENMQLLHKYILTIFLLYCRHLSITHKQDKTQLTTNNAHFKRMLAKRVQELTQITFMMRTNPTINGRLKQLKFLDVYLQIHTHRIHHKHNKAFLKQIVSVYYVFDRLVQRLDRKIEEKISKIDAEIIALQAKYAQNKAASIKEEKDSETSSIQDIKNNLMELRMSVDGDSDNEVNSNAISDEQIRALQQLINQSQQKNPSMRVVALEQLASLLPSSTTALANKVLIPQAPSMITTAPATVLVQTLPSAAMESGNLLTVTPAQISRPLILLGGAGGLAKTVGGYGSGDNGQQGYYYVNNGSNYQTYTQANAYQNGGTSSNGYGDASSGGFGSGFANVYGQGNGQGNGGPFNAPFGFHSQHLYDPYDPYDSRNNNRNRNPNEPTNPNQNNNNNNNNHPQAMMNHNPHQQPMNMNHNHNNGYPPPMTNHNNNNQGLTPPNMMHPQHPQPPPPSMKSNNGRSNIFSSIFRRRSGNNRSDHIQHNTMMRSNSNNPTTPQRRPPPSIPPPPIPHPHVTGHCPPQPPPNPASFQINHNIHHQMTQMNHMNGMQRQNPPRNMNMNMPPVNSNDLYFPPPINTIHHNGGNQMHSMNNGYPASNPPTVYDKFDASQMNFPNLSNPPAVYDKFDSSQMNFPTLAGHTNPMDDSPNHVQQTMNNNNHSVNLMNGMNPTSSGSSPNGYSSSCSLTSDIKHSPSYLSSMANHDSYAGMGELSSNSDSTIVHMLPPSVEIFNCKTVTDSSDSGTLTPTKPIPKLSGLSSLAPLSPIPIKRMKFHDAPEHIDSSEDGKIGSDEDPTSQRTSSGKLKKFQCNICNSYWFESTTALQMHVNTHIIMQRTTKRQSDDPNRPWQCEVCKRNFAEKCTLKRHVRIHTNEKPWKCQYCSKAFNQSCSLQAHVRIHTGERPFPCMFCEKRFRQSTHRRQHMKRVHKQQWEATQAQNKTKKKAKAKKSKK